jgi:hypothetical protein
MLDVGCSAFSSLDVLPFMPPYRSFLAILALLAIAIPIVVMTQAVSYPAGWDRIHVDMTQSDIHAAAGNTALSSMSNPSYPHWHGEEYRRSSRLVDRWMLVDYYVSGRPDIASGVRIYSVWHLGRDFATVRRREITAIPAAAVTY